MFDDHVDVEGARTHGADRDPMVWQPDENAADEAATSVGTDVDAIMAQLEYELQYRRLEIEAAHKAEQYSDVLHAKAIALEEAGQNAFAAFNL